MVEQIELLQCPFEPERGVSYAIEKITGKLLRVAVQGITWVVRADQMRGLHKQRLNSPDCPLATVSQEELVSVFNYARSIL